MSDLIRTKQSILALIREAEEIVHQCGKTLDEMDDYLSEFLTARGVIVPPCKVGDKVYEIRIKGNTPKQDYGLITKRSLKESIRYYSERLYIKEKIFSKSDRTRFGRTVFLSREEAEAALKGEDDEQRKAD